MELIDIFIGALALAIAIIALAWQRKEIKRNSRVSSLLRISSLLQERIDFHSKIIDNLNEKGENWKGHASKINHELRPMKESIDLELVKIVSDQLGKGTAKKIRSLISTNGCDG